MVGMGAEGGRKAAEGTEDMTGEGEEGRRPGGGQRKRRPGGQENGGGRGRRGGQEEGGGPPGACPPPWLGPGAWAHHPGIRGALQPGEG
jgi:hypothetical protein